MNVVRDPVERDRPADVVAGFIAAAALFAGLVAIVYRPVRVSPVALIVALVAVGIGGRHARLATIAVGVVASGWVLGMILSILADRPLW
ncbi:MAG: hypothetical protein ICV59_03240 [Thermoleophilia bacterium]|nr:hypothetical protein [Thermoleophilia bacterium]